MSSVWGSVQGARLPTSTSSIRTNSSSAVSSSSSSLGAPLHTHKVTPHYDHGSEKLASAVSINIHGGDLHTRGAVNNAAANRVFTIGSSHDHGDYNDGGDATDGGPFSFVTSRLLPRRSAATPPSSLPANGSVTSSANSADWGASLAGPPGPPPTWRARAWLLFAAQLALAVAAAWFFRASLEYSQDGTAFGKQISTLILSALSYIAVALLFLAFPAPRALSALHLAAVLVTAVAAQVLCGSLALAAAPAHRPTALSQQINTALATLVFVALFALAGAALLAVRRPRAVAAAALALALPLLALLLSKHLSADTSFAAGLNGAALQPLSVCALPGARSPHHYLPARAGNFFTGSPRCPAVPQFARVDTEGVLRIAPALCPLSATTAAAATRSGGAGASAGAAAPGQMTAVTARAPQLAAGATLLAARARAAVRVRYHLAQLLAARLRKHLLRTNRLGDSDAAANAAVAANGDDINDDETASSMARLETRLLELHPHLASNNSKSDKNSGKAKLLDKDRWAPSPESDTTVGLRINDLLGATGLSRGAEAVLLAWLADTDDAVTGAVRGAVGDWALWDESVPTDGGAWRGLATDAFPAAPRQQHGNGNDNGRGESIGQQSGAEGAVAWGVPVTVHVNPPFLSRPQYDDARLLYAPRNAIANSLGPVSVTAPADVPLDWPALTARAVRSGVADHDGSNDGSGRSPNPRTSTAHPLSHLAHVTVAQAAESVSALWGRVQPQRVSHLSGRVLDAAPLPAEPARSGRGGHAFPRNMRTSRSFALFFAPSQPAVSGSSSLQAGKDAAFSALRPLRIAAAAAPVPAPQPGSALAPHAPPPAWLPRYGEDFFGPTGSVGVARGRGHVFAPVPAAADPAPESNVLPAADAGFFSRMIAMLTFSSSSSAPVYVTERAAFDPLPTHLLSQPVRKLTLFDGAARVPVSVAAAPLTTESGAVAAPPRDGTDGLSRRGALARAYSVHARDITPFAPPSLASVLAQLRPLLTRAQTADVGNSRGKGEDDENDKIIRSVPAWARAEAILPALLLPSVRRCPAAAAALASLSPRGGEASLSAAAAVAAGAVAARFGEWDAVSARVPRDPLFVAAGAVADADAMLRVDSDRIARLRLRYTSAGADGRLRPARSIWAPLERALPGLLQRARLTESDVATPEAALLAAETLGADSDARDLALLSYLAFPLADDAAMEAALSSPGTGGGAAPWRPLGVLDRPPLVPWLAAGADPVMLGFHTPDLVPPREDAAASKDGAKQSAEDSPWSDANTVRIDLNQLNAQYVSVTCGEAENFIVHLPRVQPAPPLWSNEHLLPAQHSAMQLNGTEDGDRNGKSAPNVKNTEMSSVWGQSAFPPPVAPLAHMFNNNNRGNNDLSPFLRSDPCAAASPSWGLSRAWDLALCHAAGVDTLPPPPHSPVAAPSLYDAATRVPGPEELPVPAFLRALADPAWRVRASPRFNATAAALGEPQPVDAASAAEEVEFVSDAGWLQSRLARRPLAHSHLLPPVPPLYWHRLPAPPAVYTGDASGSSSSSDDAEVMPPRWLLETELADWAAQAAHIRAAQPPSQSSGAQDAQRGSGAGEASRGDAWPGGVRQPDVVVLFIDALSRPMFHRRMPLTAALLSQLQARSNAAAGKSKTRNETAADVKLLNELEPAPRVMQYFHYHVVEKNTVGNLGAMLSRSTSPLQLPLLSYNEGRFRAEHTAPLPAAFRAAGYATGFVAGRCVSMEREAAWTPAAWDVEVTAPFCHPEHNNDHQWTNFVGPYSMSRRCIAGRSVHAYELEVTRQFLTHPDPSAAVYASPHRDSSVSAPLDFPLPPASRRKRAAASAGPGWQPPDGESEHKDEACAAPGERGRVTVRGVADSAMGTGVDSKFEEDDEVVTTTICKSKTVAKHKVRKPRLAFVEFAEAHEGSSEVIAYVDADLEAFLRQGLSRPQSHSETLSTQSSAAVGDSKVGKAGGDWAERWARYPAGDSDFVTENTTATTASTASDSRAAGVGASAGAGVSPGSVARGWLRDAVVMLVSDHGSHMGPAFEFTAGGRLEQKLPLLTVLTPRWLERELPGAVEALEANQQRFVTAFDVYATLRHLAVARAVAPVTSPLSPDSEASKHKAGVQRHPFDDAVALRVLALRRATTRAAAESTSVPNANSATAAAALQSAVSAITADELDAAVTELFGTPAASTAAVARAEPVESWSDAPTAAAVGVQSLWSPGAGAGAETGRGAGAAAAKALHAPTHYLSLAEERLPWLFRRAATAEGAAAAAAAGGIQGVAAADALPKDEASAAERAGADAGAGVWRAEPWAVSLMERQVSEKRTCADAAVPRAWCACANYGL